VRNSRLARDCAASAAACEQALLLRENARLRAELDAKEQVSAPHCSA
jgi:hypothetical protein